MLHAVKIAVAVVAMGARSGGGGGGGIAVVAAMEAAAKAAAPSWYSLDWNPLFTYERPRVRLRVSVG